MAALRRSVLPGDDGGDAANGLCSGRRGTGITADGGKRYDTGSDKPCAEYGEATVLARIIRTID